MSDRESDSRLRRSPLGPALVAVVSVAALVALPRDAPTADVVVLASVVFVVLCLSAVVTGTSRRALGVLAVSFWVLAGVVVAFHAAVGVVFAVVVLAAAVGAGAYSLYRYELAVTGRLPGANGWSGVTTDE